jgi:UDP-N-acetylglucosamine 2-epimerase (non-hydrolysing)
VTVTEGTNKLLGEEPERIVPEARAVLEGRWKQGRVPELWDGKAAERIASVIAS